MKFSRRELLKTGVLIGASVPIAGCERIYSEVSQRLGQSIPDTVSVAHSANIDPVFHLLSRAGYGPWPGELQRAKQMGVEAWIDEQLQPEKLDDRACDLRARRFESLLIDPGNAYEFKKSVIRDDITRHTLLRAVYSKRQLFEAMVGFWTDHLNIYLEKGDCIYLKPSDDRLVIRKHALGNFHDMIKASAVSPAMLVYLDGKENKRGKQSDVPNENYARELLELHTLGVHGGYTQHDVYEVARCLTGWRLHSDWQKGKVYFDSSLHDDGEKHVFGTTIPAGGGEKDLDRVVELACNHPSTAKHIAGKLITRFVCDDPPQSLVDRIAAIFTSTGGDIKPMIRTILTSSEFQESRGTKFKRPLQYIASSLRIIGADTHAHQPLIEYLMRMGQAPFQYPTPDGYPDESQPWMGTLLWRWNFALDLASNRVPTVKVPVHELTHAIARAGNTTANPFLGEAKKKESSQNTAAARGKDHQNAQNKPFTASSIAADFAPARLFQHFVGRCANRQELSAFENYIANCPITDESHQAELLGLILTSPAFQRF